MRHLGSGKYSDCFCAWRGGRVAAVKVSYYQDATIATVSGHANRGDLRAAQSAKDRDAVSVSEGVARVAQTLRDRCVTPHIVHVYAESDVLDLPPRLAGLLPPRRLSRSQSRCCHVCVMELCSQTLTTFVARSPDATDRVTRCLVFQVLYTLACLQAVLPGFRHNDLSTNNVLVRAHAKETTARYAFAGQSAHCAGRYSVALADFDFTHVPGALPNERILSGKYGITGSLDNGYDAHFFLAGLGRLVARRPELVETAAFLASLRLQPRSRSPGGAAFEPFALLRHPYFGPLRAPLDARLHYALP